MATIKNCTDLEQSKKLSEFLPLENADIYYFLDPTPVGNIYHLIVQRVDIGIKNIPHYDEGDIPCWSLSALLDVIPKHIKEYNVLRIDISNDFAIWYDEIGYGVNNDLPDITMKSAVDACYEMIIRLNELNLL